jgi:hypothetical protein
VAHLDSIVLVDGRTIEDTHDSRKSDLQNPPACNDRSRK